MGVMSVMEENERIEIGMGVMKKNKKQDNCFKYIYCICRQGASAREYLDR